MGNPKKPPTGEIDVSLRKFVDQCWTHHLRRPGPPAVQRYGNLVRLALMPIGDYAIDSAPGGASALYRFRPVIRRLRGPGSRQTLLEPAKGYANDRPLNLWLDG